MNVLRKGSATHSAKHLWHAEANESSELHRVEAASQEERMSKEGGAESKPGRSHKRRTFKARFCRTAAVKCCQRLRRISTRLQFDGLHPSVGASICFDN